MIMVMKINILKTIMTYENGPETPPQNTTHSNIMKVKIKKLHPKAVKPFKTYPEDFCYDVVATSREELAPNVYRYGIGLAFQIERGDADLMIPFRNESHRNLYDGYYVPDLSIDFRPRSSVWKTGMVLSNCEGTIDELYRGEVSAVFYHVLPSMPKYSVGDRIGQIKLGLTIPMEFETADELDETERGDGAYGSTGK